ncbi:MAG: GNAT family N-acetyltransferase [Pseudomonadota bacterium]
MRSLGVEGAWMMIVDDEIVGLCGFKGAPSADGEAEIGYGVAPARRMRGYATAAVGELIGEARNIGVRMLRAETEASNIASEKALRRNGFRLVGEREADGKPFHDWALEAVS